MEHGLEYITLYVKKYIAHLGICSVSPLVWRRVDRGTRIGETGLLHNYVYVGTMK